MAIQTGLPGLEEVADAKAGERYTCYGKQVKLCGEHYADAISTEAASNIADALNAAEMQQDWARLIAKVK